MAKKQTIREWLEFCAQPARQGKTFNPDDGAEDDGRIYMAKLVLERLGDVDLVKVSMYSCITGLSLLSIDLNEATEMRRLLAELDALVARIAAVEPEAS